MAGSYKRGIAVANFLQKMIWKILPPVEVTATKALAKAFLKQHAGMSEGELRAGVMRLLSDAEKTIYSIRCDKMVPVHLALLLISNVAGDSLQSGQHHFYRGALGIVGQDMLKVFRLAVKTMEEKGYHSEEESRKDYEWIRKQIAEAG